MKNKIKSFKFAISVMMLTLPALVSAQVKNDFDTDAGLSDATINGVVENLMKWILGLVGFIAIIAFCISGIMYLTAAGDEDRQKSAKSAMVYSIVGIVVALGGFIIWQAAQAMLGADSTDF